MKIIYTTQTVTPWFDSEEPAYEGAYERHLTPLYAVMTLRFSDAYNEGYDAYENGTGFDNPYTQGTQLWYDWEDGWGDAWTYWNDDPA